MRKGIVFSVEAVYVVLAVFVVIIALFSFLRHIENPNYDVISSMKIAHDMGEDNTSKPPTGFNFSDCSYIAVNITYYEYEGISGGVCPK